MKSNQSDCWHKNVERCSSGQAFHQNESTSRGLFHQKVLVECNRRICRWMTAEFERINWTARASSISLCWRTGNKEEKRYDHQFIEKARRLSPTRWSPSSLCSLWPDADGKRNGTRPPRISIAVLQWENGISPIRPPSYPISSSSSQTAKTNRSPPSTQESASFQSFCAIFYFQLSIPLLSTALYKINTSNNSTVVDLVLLTVNLHNSLNCNSFPAEKWRLFPVETWKHDQQINK